MKSTVLAVLLAAGLAGAAPNGKLIYTASCAGCHGLKGEGGGGGLFPGMKTTQRASYAAFKKSMLQGVDFSGKKFQPVMPTFGRIGFAPAYGQPPSGKAPSEAELKAVYNYIRSLKIR